MLQLGATGIEEQEEQQEEEEEEDDDDDEEENMRTPCFGNWICFRPHVRRETLCWVPQKELTSVTGSSFGNAMFSCSLVLLGYRTMGKVQKSSNAESYIPSSEPFRIYMN
jgi:hypothetical protein